MPKPPDRVRPAQYEEVATGGDPFDDNMGLPSRGNPEEDALTVAGLYGGEPGKDGSDEIVAFYREADEWFFEDTNNAGAARKSLTDLASASGITPATHRDLDQLVHEIAENSFDEVIRSGFLVTDLITWTDAGKTTKIREQNIVYTGLLPTQITYTQYDAAGVAAEIVVETLTYTGFFVTSVTRVRTL